MKVRWGKVEHCRFRGSILRGLRDEIDWYDLVCPGVVVFILRNGWRGWAPSLVIVLKGVLVNWVYILDFFFFFSACLVWVIVFGYEKIKDE